MDITLWTLQVRKKLNWWCMHRTKKCSRFEISFGFDVIVSSFPKSFYFSKTHSFTTIIINKNTNTELFRCAVHNELRNYNAIFLWFFGKNSCFSCTQEQKNETFSFVFFADFRESSIEFGWESFLQNHFVPYNRVLFTPMNEFECSFLYASIFFSSFHTHFTFSESSFRLLLTRSLFSATLDSLTKDTKIEHKIFNSKTK